MKHKTTAEANRLLLDGQIALSQVEAWGVRVDKTYLDTAIKDVSGRVRTMEEELKAHPDGVYKTWRRQYGDRTKLGSRDQLSNILFGKKDAAGKVVGGMGYTPRSYTAGGIGKASRASAAKATLEDVDLPFVRLWLKAEELKKALSTNLMGLLRECVETPDGWYCHPSYNLNTVSSFRSSCDKPNFQNQPVRMPEIAEIIRRCFIAPDGWHFGEIDFAQIEVRIAACYTQDPNLIAYIKDKSKDMHRDEACGMFFLRPEQVTKDARHTAKNRWVFPQFYGSVYFQCAREIWEALGRQNIRVKDGPLLHEHLAAHGITELGDCTPTADNGDHTFVAHLKKREAYMWDKRFPVYTRWKKDWFDQYVKDGGCSSKVGFAWNGPMSRNEVLNYCIQCDAFQCNLWSLIQLVKALRRYRMKTRIVGEIHDSQQFVSPPGELNDFLDLAHEVMVDGLMKHWDWIIIPLETESEVCPVGKSWFDKAQWVRGEDQSWGPIKK